MPTFRTSEEIPGLVEKLREGNYDIVSGWKKKRLIM
jgi:hypothetical protein